MIKRIYAYKTTFILLIGMFLVFNASAQIMMPSYYGAFNKKATLNNTIINNALNFDGVNDYVAIGNGYPATDELTYEAWLYPKFDGDFKSILDHDNWALGAIHFQFSGSILHFDVNGAGDNACTYTFTENTWYHVAVVYSKSGGYIKFYVNGSLINTINPGSMPTITGSQAITMGAWGGGRFFSGIIDDVRIWNTARTQTEIQSNMNNELIGTESGLKAYYTLNQGIPGGDNTIITIITDKTNNVLNGTLTNFAKTGTSSNFVIGKDLSAVITNGLILNLDAANTTSYSGSGTSWKDISGNNNNATLTSGAVFANINGVSCFSFTNAYASTSITKSNSMTFSTWAKSSDLAFSCMLFNAGNAGKGPDLFFVGGGLYWNVWDSYSTPFITSTSIVTPTSIIDLNWHNYTVVNDFTSSNAKLYFDGILVGTANYRSPTYTTNLYIGGAGLGDSWFWKGSIANFQAYNRVLTPSEVSQNYNALKSRF